MTREIKFRGRRLDNGKWAYGSLLLLNDQAEIVNHDEAPLVDPSTVGQYTGMKDVNEKEIYEGDILKDFVYDWEDEVDVEILSVVTWDDPSYGFTVDSESDHEVEMRYIGNMEICGNIHDNPHLLKGGEE